MKSADKAPPVAETEPVAEAAAPPEVPNVEPTEVEMPEVEVTVEATDPSLSVSAAPVEPAPIESTVDPLPAGSVIDPPPAAPEVVEAAAESVDETIAAAADLAAASAKVVSRTLTTTADTVAAVTAEAVETAAEVKRNPANLTQGIRKMMKSTEDFVAFGQANLEAFVKSGQIWSAGMQELTKQIATSAKASFDESMSTFKAISTAKSVKEALDLQSSYAKSTFEKAMAESNKLTDASIKLTEQTLAPITARMTSAVETFSKTA